MNITKYETNLRNNYYFKKTQKQTINTYLNNIENNLIIIYPEIKYQKILGFGGLPKLVQFAILNYRKLIKKI